MLELAQHADALGYRRYWLAEHHNMPGIASAATAVLIGHVAGGTLRIRVGAGGIMLPNHAPLQVAEQFGTLASLYPDRIDLGLGRAPGTDQPTARALRRYFDSADQFPQDVRELLHYFEPVQPGQAVQAVPVAACGYRPDPRFQPVRRAHGRVDGPAVCVRLALRTRRDGRSPCCLPPRVPPSAALKQPHAMLALNVVASDSEAESRRLFTSQQQSFVNLRRGRPGKIPAPIDDIESFWEPHENWGGAGAGLHRAGRSAAGREGIAAFVERHRPDELMLTANLYDHRARLRSFELTMQAGTPATRAEQLRHGLLRPCPV